MVKGEAYGIRSIRVDGNDALAVYGAIQRARKMAITEQRPILVEVHFNYSSSFPYQISEFPKCFKFIFRHLPIEWDTIPLLMIRRSTEQSTKSSTGKRPETR